MKYSFWGIGQVGAAMIMAALASNPSTVILTVGIQGKIIFYVAKLLCAYMASIGLIFLNVGAASMEVLVDEGTFDGSWDSADLLIKKIRDRGRELTDDEIKGIDQPVIEAFRKFAQFGKDKNPKKPQS